MSQADERGEKLATRLKTFVRKLTTVEPWMATAIARGDGWALELVQRLKGAIGGIVCLTPESLSNKWIHFETGALLSTEHVWTVLLDVTPTNIRPPLGWRQHTDVTNKDQVFEMIQGIAEATGAPSRSEDLRDHFNLRWGDFEKDVIQIRQMQIGSPPRRQDRELAEETLEILRDMSRTSWRAEKTLHMLHHIYEAILHGKAPTLVEMRSSDRAEAIRQYLTGDPYRMDWGIGNSPTMRLHDLMSLEAHKRKPGDDGESPADPESK